MDYHQKTDETKTLLDAIHDNTKLITRAVEGLESTADALHRVGLVSLAKEIDMHIAGLYLSARQIQASWSVDIGNQVRHGEEMIGGMLRLVLNGVITPKEDEE